MDPEEEKEAEGRASIDSEMRLAAGYGGALALPTAIFIAGVLAQAKTKGFFQKVSSAREDFTSSCSVPMLPNFPLPQNVL